ncbi:UDP-N-acetylglucosamine 1-carboxyvinyltransferase [Orenia metallireducens]|jgi:UDP-N-acetylglucosamine 1-carboxyvinyltransferase|uniref:UDP-N-acetylglucosamine 1-carboxyvinyltransferase n=1 Tax=Orenia metallireducens TaxID=1413210 RepID=A0A285GVC7_9FIRM|nr:UDP-N-acetylglucosamine 1-carboxyvinyltransferase [Orenia metallireducens]PRX31113.1 UDP-N-acetylglucosamine 1-carboxyvinyltransferase [Orenia metallireducens]SNY27519.1 UDP-N-acetylglucosamine 1-carboxyvinyltransferase [Orenia metallireducens]
MGRFIINGGQKLQGEVTISGAKNAVLPILAGTVLSGGECVIGRVPKLRDVRVMKEVLETLGAKARSEDDKLIVDTAGLNSCEIPEELMRKMRATVFLMGPLVGRFGEFKISQPGGCSIGTRPIDLHIKGLKALGVKFKQGHGYLEGKAEKLTGAEIHLDFPSVGATENIMMAAVLAEGKTVIYNSAREPEIVDLQNFLNQLGASVRGAGTDVIKIQGVKKLHPVDYQVIPDRIEAGTFLVAAAITKGNVLVKDVIPEHIEAVIAKLVESGVDLDVDGDQIQVIGQDKWQGVNIKTLPYPGFATDMQSQFMTFLSIAEGASIVTETIFENRLKHADELRRMGADIKIEGNSAIVKGVNKLSGTTVEATDLRAGAALVLAGLVADGETIVENVYHIDRGYEFLTDKLTSLGAKIRREEG